MDSIMNNPNNKVPDTDVFASAFWHILTKWNTILQHNLAVVSIGVYPGELKNYVPANPYTGKLMVDLFTTAQNWKHPRCPSTHE